MCAEGVGEEGRFAARRCGEPDEDMCSRCIADAVGELRHAARTAARQFADQFAKAPEAAALLGNRDSEQGLALLAHFSTFRHETQPVEIHVGTAQDGRVGFTAGAVLHHVLLDGRHGQRTGRLHDAAGVDKNVLDGRAHGVGVDRHVAVDQRAGNAESFLAHQLDGRAVREQPDVAERDALPGGNRLDHGVGVVHLHADHLDLGAHRLDVVGNTGNQAAATDRHEHRMQWPLMLSQDFHGDGALAGDHVGIVERVDEGQALLRLQFECVAVGIGIAFAEQRDLAAQPANRVDLELRRGQRHHDHGARAELARAECHTLRMVAGRGANHAAGQLGRAQLNHLVVGAAQLEAEHRLLVFALEQHRVAEPGAQCACRVKCRFHSHVVDACRQDFFQVIGRGEW